MCVTDNLLYVTDNLITLSFAIILSKLQLHSRASVELSSTLLFSQKFNKPVSEEVVSYMWYTFYCTATSSYIAKQAYSGKDEPQNVYDCLIHYLES